MVAGQNNGYTPFEPVYDPGSFYNIRMRNIPAVKQVAGNSEYVTFVLICNLYTLSQSIETGLDKTRLNVRWISRIFHTEMYIGC